MDCLEVLIENDFSVHRQSWYLALGKENSQKSLNRYKGYGALYCLPYTARPGHALETFIEGNHLLQSLWWFCLGQSESTVSVAWLVNKPMTLVAGQGPKWLRTFDIRGKFWMNCHVWKLYNMMLEKLYVLKCLWNFA